MSNLKYLIKDIKIISELVDANMNKLLSKYNITSSQARILMYIFKNHSNTDITSTIIEKNLNLSRATVLGILNRLQEKKLIIITVSPSDSRIKFIKPSNKSIDLKNDICKTIQVIEDKLSNNIKENDLETFRKVLNIMKLNIKEEKND